VRGGNDNDAFLGVETIHLDEQRIERLFAFIVAAADPVAAVATDCVDFVYENDARRGFLALLEHIAHTRCANADKHLNEVRAADREERDVRFSRDGASEQRFSRSRRAYEQDPFWNSPAKLLKFLRVA